MGWVEDGCVGTLSLSSVAVLKSIIPGVPGLLAALVVLLSSAQLVPAQYLWWLNGWVG